MSHVFEIRNCKLCNQPNYLVMKIVYLVIIMSLISFTGISQETSDNERPSTFSLSLSMENAFGFYPAVFGSFGLNSSSDFTYYGMFWTNPSFGLPSSTYSSDLWLEHGFGLGFDALGGYAYINPSLGFTHGKFLSGGSESVVFDGIVPSIMFYYYPGSFTTEVYIGLYQHLRDESDGANTFDFFYYYTYPGISLSDHIAIGVHYEGLFLSYAKGGLESSYQWLGPFIKITESEKFSFRISGGANLADNINYPYSKDFYKLSVLIPLM